MSQTIWWLINTFHKKKLQVGEHDLHLPSLKLTRPLKIDGWKMNFLWEGLFSGAMLVLGRVHRHKIMIHILRLQKSPFLPWFHLGIHEEMYIPVPFAFFLFFDYIFGDTYFQNVFFLSEKKQRKNHHNQNNKCFQTFIFMVCVFLVVF